MQIKCIKLLFLFNSIRYVVKIILEKSGLTLLGSKEMLGCQEHIFMKNSYFIENYLQNLYRRKKQVKE